MKFGRVIVKDSPKKIRYRAIVNFQHGGRQQYSDQFSYLHGIKYDVDDLVSYIYLPYLV